MAAQPEVTDQVGKHLPGQRVVIAGKKPDGSPVEASFDVDGKLNVGGISLGDVSLGDVNANFGTAPTGYTPDSGGIGNLGWLGTIRKAITDRFGILGQANMAGSAPVVIASNQSAVAVSGPLTDTQLRNAAVPISGPVTDTELRAAPVPVSGDNLSTVRGQYQDTFTPPSADAIVIVRTSQYRAMLAQLIDPATGAPFGTDTHPFFVSQGALDRAIDSVTADLGALNGAATSAKQDTAQTTLTAIDGHVDGVETLLTAIDGHVDGLEGLLGSQATAAKQDTAQTTLTAIDGHVDGVETLLTAIDGHVDGLETLLGSQATAAKQDTLDTDLKARLAVLGQAAMTASAPVVIASDQTSIPVVGVASSPASGVVVPISATPDYTAGDCMGGLVDLGAVMRAANGNGVLDSITIIDHSAQTLSLSILFFSRTPAATFTDNSAFPTLDRATDCIYIVGAVTVYTSEWCPATGGSMVASKPVGIRVAAGNSQAHLFMAIQVNNAPNMADVADLIVNCGFGQN